MTRRKLTPISFSGIETLRRCPEMFRLAYECGIKQIGYASALVAGTAVHEGVGALLGGCTLSDAYAVADAAIAAEARSAAPASHDPDALAVQVERDRWSVMAYLAGYRAAWGTFAEIPMLAPLVLEAPFEAPVVNPDTGSRSRTFKQKGRVDGIVQALIRVDGESSMVGRPYLYELKTTSDTLDDAERWLRQTLQIPLYWHAMQRAGHEPLGAVVDIIKKNPIRSRKDESNEDRHLRMVEAYAKEPTKYFRRVLLDHDERRVYDARVELWSACELVKTSRRHGWLAARGAHCKGPYGYCRYRQLCWYHDFESFEHRDGFDGDQSPKDQPKTQKEQTT